MILKVNAVSKTRIDSSCYINLVKMHTAFIKMSLLCSAAVTDHSLVGKSP